MNVKRNPSRMFRRLSKILFATLGGVAIVLAVALGIFRLLVGQIPEYQTEIKNWVAAELGLVVDFETLDARLGLKGPELTLLDTTIGSGTEFLQADQAIITLDPVTLLLARRVDVSRLTLDGVRLTVERDLQGTFRLGDFALERGTETLAASIPQSVEVAIRNSELLYVDAIRDQSWRFSELDLVIESSGGDYVASGSLNPPDSLAERLDLSVDASLPEGDDEPVSWHLQAEAAALDLEALAMLVPVDMVWPISGRGAANAEIVSSGSQLASVRLEIDIADLRIAEDSEPYDRLRVEAAWQRTAADAWQLDLDDIQIRRNGRSWAPSPATGLPLSAAFSLATDDGGVQAVSLTGDFMRLDDLRPVVSAFPESQLAEQWALFEPIGDVADLDFSLERRNANYQYEFDAVFDQLAVRRAGTTPGISGVSGRVSATEDSGTIEFQSVDLSVDWPSVMRAPVEADSLTGAVVWRQGLSVIQILSVDLEVGLQGSEARASFDLKIPRDGSSPTLDLSAEMEQFELVIAKSYMPSPIMPQPVVDWLDRALVSGQGRNAELSLVGAVESFPFTQGGGELRASFTLQDATLDYMVGWPVAEAIDGEIAFLNAGFVGNASASVVGNRSDNLVVSIPDLFNPTITLEADTEGPLASAVEFFRGSPLIAERLGPGFDRVEVSGGSGGIGARLDLPLRDLSAFELDATLRIDDGSFTIRGLRPGISEFNGTIVAEEDAVSSTGTDGIFLGGPISASLMRSDEPGYRAELSVDGETSAAALAESFGLPPVGVIDGQTLWRGQLMLPALDLLATSPTRITVESNLAGVALRLPEPLAKAPGEPTNLALDLQFASGNRIEIDGNLGATRRFALEFRAEDNRIDFVRGAVEFGGGEARLPVQAGILVGGQIETLELDQWLALGSDTGIGRAGPLFLGADIDVAGLHAFGQQLGTTSLRVERGSSDWQIDIDSEAIAGQIVVPRGGDARLPIVAEMSRVYLAAAGGGELGAIDPRSLPGLRVDAGEFGFGNRQLGRVIAVIEPVPQGLELIEFQSQTANLQLDVTGSWLNQPVGTRTAIDAEIRSTDVQAALAELGLDPAVAGETATVSASVYWDEAPTAAWLDHLNGDVNLLVETGTLRGVDPGAGRVVGLMSIAALPRRLLLDFRDVFEDGFAFDEIVGSFRIIDGNAYTNDLKFGGPAAEIGVVGRTGLRDRDYSQQIVVTAEPSNMLPTVGGLLGGAGVGAALLIFTRLFKEPLRGIGRASYCLTGNWEEPVVEAIDDDESAEALRCAQLPDEMRPATLDE